MKKIALAFTAALVLNLTPANAASLKKGNAAYQNKDYATARMEWQPLANEGNAAAQYNLGLLYAYGKGVAQDYAQAAKWYRSAAMNGHTSAPNDLGVLYATGKGVPKNRTEAVKWYQMAAKRGNATAQNNLGWMYFDGFSGFIQDYVIAFMWFSIAERNGSTGATKNMRETAEKLADDDIDYALEMAHECLQSDYENCGSF